MSSSSSTPAWRRQDYLYLLGLVAAGVLAFWPLLFRHQRFYRPELFGHDWEGGYIPLATWFSRIVRQGFFPLWTSAYLCGTPIIGTDQGGYLYPSSYLFALLNIIPAYALILVGHLSLLGILTFILFRYLSLSGPASFLASLWMMLSGPVMWFSFIPLGLQELTWFLVLYLGALILLRRPSLCTWLLWVAAFGLELLAGDPETLVYSCLGVALALGLQMVLERVPLRIAFRTVFLLAGGVILGGAITLAQGLTTLEFFSHCIRSAPLDYQAYRQTWLEAKQLLSLVGLLFRGQTGELFFGLLPVALLLAGLFNPALRSARTLTRVFLALGLVLFFNPALHLTPLLYHLPVVSLFTRHYKVLPYFQLFLCLGVALGVDSLLARPRPTGLALAILILGLLDLAIPIRPLPYQLALAGGYLFLLFASRSRIRPRLLLAGLIFLTFAEILSRLWDTPHRLEDPRFSAAFHQFFRSADRQARTAILYPLTDRMRDVKLPIPIQSGVWEGTSSPDNWLHLPPRRYLLFLSRIIPQIVVFRDGKLVQHYIDSAFKHLDFVTSENRHLVDYLALRYFVTYHFPLAVAERPESHFLRRVHDEIDIYENLQALPRAFLVHGVRHYEDDDQLLADLGSADRFQPRGQVLLLGPGPDQPPAPAGPVEKMELLDYQDQASRYRVTLLSPGYLSTSENYFPGWRAWVNGREAPVLRANYTFRALALPPGSSSVVFRYAPLSFRIGLWVGAASLLFFLAGELWYVIRGWISAGARLSRASEILTIPRE
jgi:hypothetical protein